MDIYLLYFWYKDSETLAKPCVLDIKFFNILLNNNDSDDNNFKDTFTRSECILKNYGGSPGLFCTALYYLFTGGYQVI